MMTSGNEAEIKVKVKRNPRKALRNIFLVVITLYVVFLGFKFVKDQVIARMADAGQIERGTIQVTQSFKGLLIRDEKVVSAPRSGTLKILAAEGERVRVGDVVAQVVSVSLDTKSGEKMYNIVSPRAGVVSYHLDGLEEICSPAGIEELDLNKIEILEIKSNQMRAGTQVMEGKPVFKVFNNLDPLMIIGIGQSGPFKWDLAKQKTAPLYLGSNKDEEYKAEIIETGFRGKSNQILLKLNRYNKSLINERKTDFRIVTERYEGFVLPFSAIVPKEEKKGIFIVYKQRTKWKEVEIKGMAGDKVVISGVTPDIKVILNPEYVKEGTPIK